MTIWGTAYFVSKRAANSYYRPYGYSATDVALQIAAGEIRIGKPPTKAGERVIIIDEGRRYAIEEGR